MCTLASWYDAYPGPCTDSKDVHTQSCRWGGGFVCLTDCGLQQRTHPVGQNPVSANWNNMLHILTLDLIQLNWPNKMVTLTYSEFSQLPIGWFSRLQARCQKLLWTCVSRHVYITQLHTLFQFVHHTSTYTMSLHALRRCIHHVNLHIHRVCKS